MICEFFLKGDKDTCKLDIRKTDVHPWYPNVLLVDSDRVEWSLDIK